MFLQLLTISCIWRAISKKRVHVGCSIFHTIITELKWFLSSLPYKDHKISYAFLFIFVSSQMIVRAFKLYAFYICLQSLFFLSTFFGICSCRMSDFPHHHHRIYMITSEVVIQRSQIIYALLFIFISSQMIFCAGKLSVSYICLQSTCIWRIFSRSVHVGCSIPHHHHRIEWFLSRLSYKHYRFSNIFFHVWLFSDDRLRR